MTGEALKEMVWPALLALLLPVLVGFAFKTFGSYTGRPQLGVEVLAAFMMFGTLTGLLMAMLMDNAGGAWDNAKKLIESQGQKGSEAHKAAVTGDTVGDPFKDTAGVSATDSSKACCLCKLLSEGSLSPLLSCMCCSLPST